MYEPAHPTWVTLIPPPFAAPRPRNRAKRAGLAYERAAREYLQGLSPHWAFGVWFRFGPRGRCAQPDALHFDFQRGDLTIVEIKLRHTPRAWWQLRELYLPVVRCAFPGWRYRLVEVCKWYDPSTHFPGAQRLVRSPLSPVPPACVGVHIWNVRR